MGSLGNSSIIDTFQSLSSEKIGNALEFEGGSKEFVGTISSEEDLFKASLNDQGNVIGDGEIQWVRPDGRKYKVNARELWTRY